jgi:hypothetical protein
MEAARYQPLIFRADSLGRCLGLAVLGHDGRVDLLSALAEQVPGFQANGRLRLCFLLLGTQLSTAYRPARRGGTAVKSIGLRFPGALVTTLGRCTASC